MSLAPPESLITVLEQSQALGFLGPGPVEAHVSHALGFASLVPSEPARFLDLGSGGGVPGLVLALVSWPSASGVLLDSAERRTTFLATAIDELGLGARVTVVRARAEDAGRDPSLRGAMDVVVARSFAAPPVTAECAAPLLAPSGTLVVSEPPSSAPPSLRSSPPPSVSLSSDRWPAVGLATVGLEPAASTTEPHAFRSFRLSSVCPDRYPRRSGIPAKRPLW